MDSIGKAIRSRQHISSKFEDVNTQTWEEFYMSAEGKKVVLFSTDMAASPCVHMFAEMISEVVDNDSRKCGVEVKNLIPKAKDFKMGDMRVKAPEVIKDYMVEETVILISSVRYYEDIIEQVKNMGDYTCYVVLTMEANKRKDEIQEEEVDPDRVMAEKYALEPIQTNKILFYDYGTYAGHGKYIAEKLLEIRSDLDIVWAVKDAKVTVPEGMRVVYIWDRETYIREVETAKVWVFDYVLPTFFVKRKEQIYINVKHWSSITLKTFGIVMEKRQERNREEQFIENGKKMDYVIVGSKFDEDSCRTGYAFDGEFLKFGSPRSDILFNSKDSKKKICEAYNIDEDIKMLLYAPTFRYRSKGVLSHRIQIDLNFKKMIDVLEKKFGGKWNILLRLHPNVVNQGHTIVKPEGVVDVSAYSDSQELVSACDVMITDYSSIMFEPSFVKKPVFLFATDLEEYLREERDLLLDYHSLPFPIAHTHGELEECVEKFDYDKYVESVDAFLSKHGVWEDGHASERAARFIINLFE